MKAVVFDFGNVIIRWDPFRALSHLFETRAAMSQALERAGFDAWNKEQDRGRSWADGLAAIAQDQPRDAELFHAYYKGLAAAHSDLVPGTSELITRLHGAGYPLYGLTNAAVESVAIVSGVAPAIRLLRDVIASGAEGIVKPDPALFRIAAARIGRNPSDIVFIDDAAGNCDTARALGFDAIRFTDAQALEQALMHRGML